MQREWKNLTMQEYFAADGLSRSALRCFVLQGELEYYARYIAKTKVHKDTDDMRLGRAFHAAMEKPDSWQDSYILMPEVVPDDDLVATINSIRSAAGSKAQPLKPGEEWNWKLPSHREYEAAIKVRAEKQNKELLTAEQLLVVKQQVDAVMDNSACRERIEAKNVNVEMACFATDPSLPWPLKCLVDLLLPSEIVDYKKTHERHPRDFVRAAIYRFGYDFQMGFYSHVTGRQEAALISVTDEAPFEANLFTFKGPSLRNKRQDVERQIQHLAQQYEQAMFGSDRDSQGVPYDWHSSDWSSEIPLDIRYTQGVEIEEEYA